MNCPRCFRLGASIAVFLVAGAGLSGKEPLRSIEAPKIAVEFDGTAVSQGKAPALVSYADILEPVQKAVVSIASTRWMRQPAPAPWLPPERQAEEGIGSGVVVTRDGFILTNNHVVADAHELTVTLADERTFKARVIGADPKTDVAVLKIDAEKLPVVTLADSDKLRVGDIAFAVGNPLGVGQTVTMGIVSATGRRVGILDEVQGYENFIQTDAAINQGNSGGALVDAKGRLVGINSAIHSPTRSNIGIGFAIPTNLARSIMENLVTHGKVARGFLGVEVDSLTPEIAEMLGLKGEVRGVFVSVLTPEGPAEKAGLKAYDVIVEVNDRAVSSGRDLRLLVAQLAPETDVRVRIFREGKAQTLSVKLGKLVDGLSANELLPGVHAERLTSALRRSLNIDSRVEGLLIREVAPDSPHAGRLLPDMVILEINRVAVEDLESARALLASGRNLLMVYFRGTIRPLSIVIK